MPASVRSSLNVSIFALMGTLASLAPGLASETFQDGLDSLDKPVKGEQQPGKLLFQDDGQENPGMTFQDLSANPWQEKHQLSRLILESVQAEPNEAERARRCLDAFLEEVPRDLLTLEPLLKSLSTRLLQPEDLIWQDRKAQFLFDPQPTADHDSLKPLVKLLQDLQSLPPSLPSLIEKPLQAVRAHYEDYLTRLLKPGADRPALLHPRALLTGEGLFDPQPEGIRSYRISREMALDLLSKDQYGLFLKKNRSGSHGVCQKGSVYFKGDTTSAGLRVGYESAAYLLSQILFGQGMAPSALLTLNEVEMKAPSEQSPARGDFARALAQGQSSADFFQNHPHHQPHFTDLTPHHVLQASREVKGISLDSFLEEGRSFQTLCRDGFVRESMK